LGWHHVSFLISVSDINVCSIDSVIVTLEFIFSLTLELSLINYIHVRLDFHLARIHHQLIRWIPLILYHTLYFPHFIVFIHLLQNRIVPPVSILHKFLFTFSYFDRFSLAWILIFGNKLVWRPIGCQSSHVTRLELSFSSELRLVD